MRNVLFICFLICLSGTVQGQVASKSEVNLKKPNKKRVLEDKQIKFIKVIAERKKNTSQSATSTQ